MKNCDAPFMYLLKGFRDRLHKDKVSFDIVDDVKTYLNEGEYSLALEIFVQQLYEWDIPISAEEHKSILELKTLYGVGELNIWRKLPELVKKRFV